MDEKDFELAEAITQKNLEIAMARARHRVPPPPDFQGNCACGSRIPTLRIMAGYFNCLKCQERYEIKLKQGVIEQ